MRPIKDRTITKRSLSTMIAAALQQKIRRGAVSRGSPLFFLVPPVAALIGWLLLDMPLPPLAWVGPALAAAGVVLAT
jgi:drug/metabolite transporter (DMT)-like permease